MAEDRWVHAVRRLTSIEFSFDPCNTYRDGVRGVGYPADARSVGDSHPSCFLLCDNAAANGQGSLCYFQSELVGDVAVPVSVRQVVLFCALRSPDARPRLNWRRSSSTVLRADFHKRLIFRVICPLYNIGLMFFSTSWVCGLMISKH